MPTSRRRLEWRSMTWQCAKCTDPMPNTLENIDMNLNINKNILPRGGRVLVALSGGADSVCLLHALYSLQAELGLTVIAAHYSHGIRKDKASQEEAFVHSLCDSMQIEYHTRQGDVPAYAKQHRMGLEEAARTLRYGYLYELAEDLECDAIAVAHNREDSAETVLFNLVRGAGLAGLGGIPAVTDLVVRPLLGVSRANIECYNKTYGLEWITDESNFDEHYSRNRIRHSVLPQLRTINPEADAAICRAARNLAQTQDFILQSALQLMACDRGLGRIDRRLLRSTHPALYHTLLTLLICEVKGDPRLADARKTEAVFALALGDRSSGSIDLGDDLQARVEYDDLCIERKAAEEELPTGSETLLIPGVPLMWNGWEILLGGNEGIPLDHKVIEGPLIVRSRRPGDVIHLRSGHKSIKKFLIDQKIPVKNRDRIPVICDNNKVVLLGDLACDQDAATADQNNAVWIRCRRI